MGSPDIIREVASVLRATFAWDVRRIHDTLKAIAHTGDIVVPDFTLEVIAEDPPDNCILECAVAGNANLIVSGNLTDVAADELRDELAKTIPSRHDV